MPSPAATATDALASRWVAPQIFDGFGLWTFWRPGLRLETSEKESPGQPSMCPSWCGDIWVWLKIQEPGQTAGDSLWFHLPWYHFGAS